MKKIIFQVGLSGIWIAVSEFVRNEMIFKHLWVQHYNELGIVFKTEPLNGFIWILWSFIVAFLIQRLNTKFSTFETLALTWVVAFLLMWFVIGNLDVLPPTLLLFAVPLSVLEIVIAWWIQHKMTFVRIKD
jgi:hypothetical protein